MPSRRIASSANLSPLQDTAINPFSSFDSNIINKLTRIVSNGKDGVVEGLNIITKNSRIESIRTVNLFESGALYNDALKNKWTFDKSRAWLSIDRINDQDIYYLNGFKLKDLVDVECREICYKIDFADYGLDDYVGRDVNTVISFEFNLVNGSPSQVIASVGKDSRWIKYPRNIYTNHVRLDVKHNFKCDKLEDGLVLKLGFVVNPFDTYNEYANCDKSTKPEYYNGQSEIHINKISYKLHVLSYEEKTNLDYYSDSRIQFNFPTSQVHPTHTIYVTPGVAIKDDVMLDEKGLNKFHGKPIVNLDVGDPKSWIKGNPFTIEDFTFNGSKQYAYVFNQYQENNILEGTFNTENNNLEFSYNGHVIQLNDDLSPSEYDIQLDFEVVEHGVDDDANKIIKIKFPERTLDGDLKNLYGQRIYCVSTLTGNVIHQFELQYDEETWTYPEQTKIFTYEQLKLRNISKINDIKFVAALGPIKVSGNYRKVNQQTIRWANVVIYYSYFKHPQPNTSYIGLIRDEDLEDPCYREDYLVLGSVRFVSPNTVDIICYGNRQQLYRYENCARHIDYGHHISIEEKNLWTDPDGNPYNPTTVSHALTLLMRMIKLYSQNIITNSKNYIEHSSTVEGEYTNTVSEEDETKWIIPFIHKEKTSRAEKVFKKTTVEIDGTEGNEINVYNIKNLFKRVTNTEDHKLDKPEGYEGEVLYNKGNNSDVEFRRILEDDIYPCTTQADIDKCKYNSVDYDYIYNHWLRFSHHNGKQWGYDSDWTGNENGVNAWRWNNTIKRIVQPSNTNEITGFVSTKNLKYIDVTVRFKSTDVDDDTNGLVLMVMDSNGKHHTISFTRNLPSLSPYVSDPEAMETKVSSGGYGFVCVLDSNLPEYYVFPLPTDSMRIIKIDDETDPTNRHILKSTYDSYGHVPLNELPDTERERRVKNAIYKYRIGDRTCPVGYNPLEQRYCIPASTSIWGQTYSNRYGYTSLYCLGEDYDNINNYGTAGWSAFSGGVILNLKYYTNELNHTIIECKTTRFLQTENEDYSFRNDMMYTIDIDALLEDPRHRDRWEILKLFKNGCRWGYLSSSQPNSYFENIRIETDQSLIVDGINNEVLRCNNAVWSPIGQIKDYLKKGTIYYNSITQKKYWYDLDGNLTCIDKDVLSKNETINLIYPVGSIYISIDNRNPGDIFNYGRWVKVSQGRMLMGADNSNTGLNTTLDSGLPNIAGYASASNSINNFDYGGGALIPSNKHYSGQTWRISGIPTDTAFGNTQLSKEDSSETDAINTISDSGVIGPRGIYNDLRFDAHESNSIYGTPGYKNQPIVQPPVLIVNIWKRLPDEIVTFHVIWKDWNGNTLKEEDVELGQSATPPTQPSRVGYTFMGWSENYLQILTNTIITAVYNVITCAVTFNYKTTTGTQVSKVVNVNYGEDATAPTIPVWTGHTFSRWSDNLQYITQNKVINAEYDNVYCQVTFKYTAGSTTQNISTSSVVYGTAITLPTTPSVTGYSFNNWDKPNGTIITTDTVINATYKPNQYTIAFDSDGGTLCDPITVTYNSTYPTLPTTTRNGYTFNGWYLNDTKITSGSNVAITSNVTLVAHWTKNYVTITYNSNY